MLTARIMIRQLLRLLPVLCCWSVAVGQPDLRALARDQRFDARCEAARLQVDTVLYLLHYPNAGKADTTRYPCVLRFTSRHQLVSCFTRVGATALTFYLEKKRIRKVEWYEDEGDLYTCFFSKKKRPQGTCGRYYFWALTLLQPWVRGVPRPQPASGASVQRKVNGFYCP